jgi:hypothetical protein
MPIHIEEFVSDVTVVEDDLPLSRAQLLQIAEFVEQYLKEKQQQQQFIRESTVIRSSAEPSIHGADSGGGY